MITQFPVSVSMIYLFIFFLKGLLLKVCKNIEFRCLLMPYCCLFCQREIFYLIFGIFGLQ